MGFLGELRSVLRPLGVCINIYIRRLGSSLYLPLPLQASIGLEAISEYPAASINLYLCNIISKLTIIRITLNPGL